jgi:hypothetical protein
MSASPPTHPWMTHSSFAGSALSGLPLPPAKAAPCFLDQFASVRPQGHADEKANI